MARKKRNTVKRLKGRGPTIALNRYLDDQAMEGDADPNDPRSRLNEEQDNYDLNDPFIDNSEQDRGFYEMKYNDDNNGPAWVNNMIQRASQHVGGKKAKKQDKKELSLIELLHQKKDRGELKADNIDDAIGREEKKSSNEQSLMKGYLRNKRKQALKAPEWAPDGKMLSASDPSRKNYHPHLNWYWRLFKGERNKAKNYGKVLLIDALLEDLKTKYNVDNPVIDKSDALKIYQAAARTLRPNHNKKVWLSDFTKYVKNRLRLFQGADTRSEVERKADALSADHGLDPSKSYNASIQKARSTCDILKKMGVSELTTCVHETMKYREKAEAKANATGKQPKYKVIKTRNLECTPIPFTDHNNIVKYRMKSICANCHHQKNTIIKHSLSKEGQLLTGGAVEFIDE